MNFFIQIISVIQGLTFELFTFFYLVKIKITKRDIFFLTIIFTIIFLMIGLGYTGAYLSTILEGGFLYLYFKNRTSNHKLIGAILLTLTTSIVIDFSTFTIDKVLSLPINYILFIDPFFYLITFIILYYYHPLDKIEEDNTTINLWILSYLFITLNIAGFTIFTTPRVTPAFILIFCLLVLQCSFTVFVYQVSKQIQQKKLQLQEKKNLLLLIQNLEENQSKLKRFKHDYQNLLNSLKLSALNGDNQTLLNKLEAYSRDNLGEDALWQFQDTKNINNEVLRSIFINIKKNTFSYKVGTRIINVNFSNILYISTTKFPHKLKIVTSNGQGEFSGDIKTIEQNYPLFFKASQSSLINLQNVETINTKKRLIKFSNNDYLKYSRSRSKELNNLYKNLTC